MENLKSALPIVEFVLVLIVLVRLELLSKKIRKFNKRKKALFFENYPDLTMKDYKYHEQKVLNYQRYYLAGKTSRWIQNIVSIGFFVLICSGVSVLLIYEDFFVGSLMGCLALIFVAAYLYLQPSYAESVAFWRAYEDKNPENDLKVVIIPEEELKSFGVLKSQQTMSLYALCLAVLWFLLLLN